MAEAVALTPEALWPAIVARYLRDPELQGLCLQVQDEHDADVVFLLLMSVLDEAGLGLEEGPFAALEARAREWRDFAVVPLRALRRRKADQDGPLAPWEPIRQSLKALELEAEKQELSLLAPLLGAARADAPGGLVARYLEKRGVGKELAGALAARLG